MKPTTIFTLTCTNKGTSTGTPVLFPDKLYTDAKVGFTFTIYKGKIIRPIPCFWDKSFLSSKGEPKVLDMMMKSPEDAARYFGETIYNRLRKKKSPTENILDIYDYHHFARANPWKGKYWFRLKTGNIIVPFFALKLWSIYFYIGFKGYDIDPVPGPIPYGDRGDITWAEDLPQQRALCPSITLRGVADLLRKIFNRG